MMYSLTSYSSKKIRTVIITSIPPNYDLVSHNYEENYLVIMREKMSQLQCKKKVCDYDSLRRQEHDADLILICFGLDR